MEFKFDKEKKKDLLFFSVLIAIAIALYFFVQNIGYFTDKLGLVISILTPFIIGFGIAYILWRPMIRIERLLRKIKFKNSQKILTDSVLRVISIVIVYILLFLAITLISMFIIPQLKDSLMNLYLKTPSFISTLQSSADAIMDSVGFKGNIYQMLSTLLEKFWGTISDFISNAVPIIINASLNITSAVSNFIIGIIVSIYVLNSKETFQRGINRLCDAFLPSDLKRKIYKVVSIFDDTFGGYINGQLTDAIVVGSLCFVLMLILKLPFALLIATIVMMTNVIPMIGPFIGAVPSAFIILMSGTPMQLLIFIIMIFVLQQIDGNILVPRIVGNSTGLSGFWVLFSIVVAGGLFGIIGIIFCVPTVSVIFKLIDIAVEKRLANKTK